MNPRRTDRSLPPGPASGNRLASTTKETAVRTPRFLTAFGFAVALALAALPARAAADEADYPVGGTIAIGARVCESIPVDPLDCAKAGGTGPLYLVSDAGDVTLTADEAMIHGGTMVWGEAGNVPVTDYRIHLENMQVPNGYDFLDIVAAPGTQGGSGVHGPYVSLSEQQMSAELFLVFVPDDGADPGAPAEIDSDGDGFSDYHELDVLGSNPHDPDTDGDGLGDGEEAVLGTSPTLRTPTATATDPEVDGTNPYDADSDDGANDGADQIRSIRLPDGDGAPTATERRGRESDPFDPSDSRRSGGIHSTRRASTPAVQAGPTTATTRSTIRRGELPEAAPDDDMTRRRTAPTRATRPASRSRARRDRRSGFVPGDRGDDCIDQEPAPRRRRPRRSRPFRTPAPARLPGSRMTRLRSGCSWPWPASRCRAPSLRGGDSRSLKCHGPAAPPQGPSGSPGAVAVDRAATRPSLDRAEPVPPRRHGLGRVNGAVVPAAPLPVPRWTARGAARGSTGFGRRPDSRVRVGSRPRSTAVCPGPTLSQPSPDVPGGSACGREKAGLDHPSSDHQDVAARSTARTDWWLRPNTTATLCRLRLPAIVRLVASCLAVRARLLGVWYVMW